MDNASTHSSDMLQATQRMGQSRASSRRRTDPDWEERQIKANELRVCRQQSRLLHVNVWLVYVCVVVKKVMFSQAFCSLNRSAYAPHSGFSNVDEILTRRRKHVNRPAMGKRRRVVYDV
jgi:hypothetical protein